MTNCPATFWNTCWSRLAALPESKALRIALCIWIVFAGTVAIIVAVQPDRHTATYEYQRASARWWNGDTIYQKTNGYLYLPQWAMIYTPYQMLPKRVGEPLWRMTMLAFLAFVLWKAAGKISPERQASIFLVATVLLFPSALASARNGQVNMPLGTLYLFTAITLSERRWFASAALLTLALVLKPISIVPILLGIVLYPQIIIPLIACIALMLGAAFIHPHPSYVSEQYRIFVETLIRAGKPATNTWCDFAGILRSLHLQIPDLITMAVRAVAALVTFGLAWKSRLIRDPFRAAFAILFFAVVYLMLFNPRTETNSYIMLGTFIGLWGAYEGLIAKRLCRTAWILLLALICGTENYGWPIFPLTDHWLKPLATLCLAVWLLIQIARAPKGEAVLLDSERRN